MPKNTGLKGQSYYIEPPFSYRPSVAEYLTTFRVTINGIIADIMHLDKKGNLNIEEYLDDGLRIVLKNDTGLNDNELFLWKFLKTTMDRGKIKFSDMKKIETAYEKEVITKTAGKFGSKLGFNPGKTFKGFAIFGFFVSVAWSLISGIISVPFQVIFIVISLVMASQNIVLRVAALVFMYLVYLALPLAVIFFLSKRKLVKSHLERSFLFKEILLELVKLQLLVYGVGFAFAAVVFLAIALLQFVFFLIVLLPVWFVLMVFYYNFYGRIAYKFFYWLFETEASSENRLQWISFKQFILNRSAIEERTLKHYELWDSFYYYSLAVGAIKKPF